MGGLRYNTADEAFDARYAKGAPDECWLWLGPVNHAGYGDFQYAGKRRIASRFSLEREIGSPLGAACACHRCDNPGCVNPAHLFVGSHGDNARDRAAKKRGNGQSQPTCSAGHEWTSENTYHHRERRQCRACNRAAVRRYQQRRAS